MNDDDQNGRGAERLSSFGTKLSRAQENEAAAFKALTDASVAYTNSKTFPRRKMTEADLKAAAKKWTNANHAVGRAEKAAKENR